MDYNTPPSTRSVPFKCPGEAFQKAELLAKEAL